MTAVEELNRLLEDETLMYRDIKTQYAGYAIKKITIWSTNEEFLFGLLYDLFDGHVFGSETVVEVLLLVEEDQLEMVETVYCSFMLGGLPKLKEFKISSCLEDMKKSDYLILHSEVDWGPEEKLKSRMDIIKENFASFRTWGMKINSYLPKSCQVLLFGDCLSPMRLILGLYSPDFPHHNIHGLTRHYERAAACLLGNKLKIGMRELKGIGVFGEDIVESTNSWIQVSPEDHEGEAYEESVMYYQPDLYQMLKINEKTGGISMEDLERSMNHREEINLSTQTSNSSTNRIKEEEKPESDPERSPWVDFTKHERQIYPPFGIPELDECSPGSYINDWQLVALDRQWLTEGVQGLHDLPEEWKTESKMSRLLNKEPPVKSLYWVVGRLADEKFHCYTLPKKCKTDQSGWSFARGVSDYLIFLLKKSSTPKRTNALVCSSGLYNVPSGMFFSFPVILKENNRFQIICGYRVSETTHMRIQELVKVLEGEYNFILQLYEDFPSATEHEDKDSAEPCFNVEEGTSEEDFLTTIIEPVVDEGNPSTSVTEEEIK